MSIAKRFAGKRLVLCCISLLVFFTFVCPTHSQTVTGKAQSRKVVKIIVKRLVANEKTVKSMTANLTLIRYDVTLDISDTATGTFAYLPKLRTTRNRIYARIDWVKPVSEQIVVIGDDFELYRPRLNQVIFGKIKNVSVNSPLKFLHMSRIMLDKNYSVNYLGRTKTTLGLKMSTLRVSPTSDKTFRWAEFWIDKSGVLRQVKFFENNGDTATLSLSNIKKNAMIQGEIFRLRYSKNVKRIKV